MGLDAYLYYQCSYRPQGSLDFLNESKRLTSMLRIMDEKRVPSVKYQLRTARGVEERTVHRAEAMRAAQALQELPATCAPCPVTNGRWAPGCSARVNYPVDDVALAVLREALEINASDLTPPADGFIRSLLEARDCNGERWLALLKGLNARPTPAGSTPVAFPLDGRVYNITVYMVLEHLFFRSFLRPDQALQVREWFRAYYTAIGERIGSQPDPNAAAAALFGSSESLQDLSALGDLFKRAEKHGLGVLLDG
ncbi:MAG: hypothetical protein U0271_28875 [Polyangiaceae bacterium]